MAADTSPVRETRVALTAHDYERTLSLFRDALGLPVLEAWDLESGRGAVLDAGRATIEVLSAEQARHVEDVEAHGDPPDVIRLALEVEDSEAAASALVRSGAELVRSAVVTPWAHRNVRVRTPDGVQLTLFTTLGGDASPG